MLPKIEEARKIKASMEQLPVAPVMMVDNQWLHFLCFLSFPFEILSATFYLMKAPKFNDDYGDTVPSKPLLMDIPAASTLRKQTMPDSIGAALEGMPDLDFCRGSVWAF